MIFALQCAYDAAFPSLTADGLQSLDVMSETFLCSGLIFNTTKTEILSTSSPDAPTFPISWIWLKNSEYFTYLGSNLSFSVDLTNEIHRRINLASSTFDCLSKRVFGNKNLTIHTEIVSMMQSSSPPSYIAARHGSHTAVISGYWSLFTSDVPS